jgi:integrase
MRVATTTSARYAGDWELRSCSERARGQTTSCGHSRRGPGASPPLREWVHRTWCCEKWYAVEFRKALAAAGITDYVRPFHDARHAALTNLAAAGVSPMAIMGIAGHRSMATTRQYVHLAGVVFRDEAALLEQRLLGVQDLGTNRPPMAPLSQEQ